MNAICVFKDTLKGTVRFHQCKPESETKVIIRLSGFKPKTEHAIHIHEYGDLSDGCTSACAHYNPHGTLHGSFELFGKDRHVGDLKVSNLLANRKGEVKIEFFDDLIDLFGSKTIIGRSVVIHEKEDDLGRYRDNDDERGKESGLTGNAGKRIDCSVIGVCKKAEK